MSLFFLHPIYLFGLIATTVPILIHLLNRRRLRRLRFPAVRFVLLSQRRIARTYRLRHWILLALRTFAVFLLVLLLAHPIFQTGVGLLAAGGPVSLAIVLDNSLSMKWSGGGDGFTRSKEAARLLITSLREGDRAAVIATNPAPKRRPQPRSEREAILKELDDVQIADGSADFSLALRQAYELVKQPAAQKEIWLMTDMGLTGWDRFSLSTVGQYDPLIPVKIVQVGNKEETLNATIKELGVRGRGVAVGLPIHLEASIANFTNREIKDVLVQLRLNGQNKEQRLISLSANGERTVGFQFKLAEPGTHHGSVILKKDGLAGNPASYFALELQDKIKVLLVDGDPQTSLIQSETFFLTRALNPGGERDSSLFLPTVVVPEGLHSVALESYQVVIFCNVAAIPEAVLPKVQQYVRQGGGLLFFLGDRVQMDSYNRNLFESAPPILPARIREKRTLVEAGGEKIAKVESAHAAVQGMADELLRASLQSARVRGYFRADSSTGSPLLTLANGDPLLIEKKIGPGRVLLFTTGADHDWNDLPLKTAYLPLVQSLVTYLSADKKGVMDPGVSVGAVKKFVLPPAYVEKNLKVVKPDGKEREVALAAEKEKAAASFEENDQAGIYRLSLFGTSLGKLGVPELYPVNSPFLESRLDTVDERELQAKFEPIRLEVIPLESLANGGKRMDLSLPVLLLLIATFAAEGWLAQRF